jgi:hypothetical protein
VTLVTAQTFYFTDLCPINEENENNLQNDQMRSSGVGVPGGSSPTRRVGDMR